MKEENKKGTQNQRDQQGENDGDRGDSAVGHSRLADETLIHVLPVRDHQLLTAKGTPHENRAGVGQVDRQGSQEHHELTGSDGPR